MFCSIQTVLFGSLAAESVAEHAWYQGLKVAVESQTECGLPSLHCVCTGYNVIAGAFVIAMGASIQARSSGVQPASAQDGHTD